MCAPGCIEHVRAEVSRRSLFKAGAALAATAAAGAMGAASAAARPFPQFTRVLDLTHTLTPEFPTFFGTPGIAMKQLKEIKKDGFNLMEWTVLEHSGTHIDTPIHFAETGRGPDTLPAADLVVPLAVINVVAKANASADYQLTPADIRAWEQRNGRLPDGCCVAMHAGWGRHLGTAKFLGKDNDGVFHFPGFHPEAAELLLKQRRVAGIAVDTISLDYGASKDFKTHTTWLPAGKWGLESVANLDKLPPRGATLVVGAPKIKGATGGPTRVLALL
jgi:kynurenine formamidase